MFQFCISTISNSKTLARLTIWNRVKWLSLNLILTSEPWRAKVTLLWCCVDIDLGFCTSRNNGSLCFWKFCWTSDPGFFCSKSMHAFSNSLLIFAAIQCKQWVTLILHSMQAFWKRLSLLFRGGGGALNGCWYTRSHYDCLYELISHHLNLWINDCHSLELWIIDFSNNYRVLCRI